MRLSINKNYLRSRRNNLELSCKVNSNFLMHPMTIPQQVIFLLDKRQEGQIKISSKIQWILGIKRTIKIFLKLKIMKLVMQRKKILYQSSQEEDKIRKIKILLIMVLRLMEIIRRITILYPKNHKLMRRQNGLLMQQ